MRTDEENPATLSPWYRVRLTSAKPVIASRSDSPPSPWTVNSVFSTSSIGRIPVKIPCGEATGWILIRTRPRAVPDDRPDSRTGPIHPIRLLAERSTDVNGRNPVFRSNSTGLPPPSRALRPRVPTVGLLGVGALSVVPTASGHTVTGSAGLTGAHGIVLALLGVALVGGAVGLRRVGRLGPDPALGVVLLGLVSAAAGAVMFDAFSPDPEYLAASMPFARSWYPLLALSGGLVVVLASGVVGWVRWRDRPRYVGFGLLVGLWITYPHLAGPASYSHPLGYLLVASTPLAVAYILRKDAAGAIQQVLSDPVSRRFGIGVGVVVGLFFLFITGYLSVFPEEGIPHESTVVVLPAIYQLVSWPTLEVVLPHIPFFLAVSPGQVIVVGLICSLIGLNAAVIARHWRAERRAGLTEGTAGTTAVVGSCACGCCGPLVAKFAILAAGPSLAAPLYWVFVDTASPLSSLFLIGSIALFTGSLIYSIEAARVPGSAASPTPAD